MSTLISAAAAGGRKGSTTQGGEINFHLAMPDNCQVRLSRLAKALLNDDMCLTITLQSLGLATYFFATGAKPGTHIIPHT